jgi:hypothetical protein
LRAGVQTVPDHTAQAGLRDQELLDFAIIILREDYYYFLKTSFICARRYVHRFSACGCRGLIAVKTTLQNLPKITGKMTAKNDGKKSLF